MGFASVGCFAVVGASNRAFESGRAMKPRAVQRGRYANYVARGR
jgi:hypothetical protein